MKFRLSYVLLITLLNAACGQSPNSSSSSGSASVQISGVVLKDDQPVIHASIGATDISGKPVASIRLEGDSHFRITLPAGTTYPVVLSAKIDGDEIPLKAAVISDQVTDQDISSTTTVVVNTAISLGGLNEANLAKAVGAAISQRKSSGGGGTSAGFKGDPTKQYGGWH